MGARGQSAHSISQAGTLYVDRFSGGADAVSLREALIRKLSKSRIHLVQSPSEAGAVLKGAGEVWVEGFISINPRSNDREAEYGGYLSLQLVGADGQPLWSWLATPDHLTWKSIVVNDLAGRAAKKLIEAAESAPANSSAQPSGNSVAHTALTGAGATFPAPLYEKWFEDFEQSHPGLHLKYSEVGSQLGIDWLVSGKLDFAGSDVAPQFATTAAPAEHLHRIASVLGAVVPIYNLKGVRPDLRFTPQALADIYLGKVRRWNDPEIEQSNKGANLPDVEIAVIHRSDGSGTTWVWSDYLSQVSPAWSSSVGRGTTLRWPVGTGAEHNEGVAEDVKNTPNSIGYVELTYAIQHELSFAAVRNRAGKYIRADLDTVTEAARSAGDSAELPLTISNSPAKNAYPIAAFTWIVVPAQTANPEKRTALFELLRWVLTTGQNECSALGYAPLPREVVERQLRLLNNAALVSDSAGSR